MRMCKGQGEKLSEGVGEAYGLVLTQCMRP